MKNLIDNFRENILKIVLQNGESRNMDPYLFGSMLYPTLIKFGVYKLKDHTLDKPEFQELKPIVDFIFNSLYKKTIEDFETVLKKHDLTSKSIVGMIFQNNYLNYNSFDNRLKTVMAYLEFFEFINAVFSIHMNNILYGFDNMISHTHGSFFKDRGYKRDIAPCFFRVLVEIFGLAKFSTEELRSDLGFFMSRAEKNLDFFTKVLDMNESDVNKNSKIIKKILNSNDRNALLRYFDMLQNPDRIFDGFDG